MFVVPKCDTSKLESKVCIRSDIHYNTQLKFRQFSYPKYMNILAEIYRLSQLV